MNDSVPLVNRALQALTIAILVTAALAGCGGGESAGAAGSAMNHDSVSSTPANGG